MSVPLPNLDDRRWVDLVEEGRSLIPFYAPEWTDHNIHDPGITVLELFAWIAEMDVYWVNRIPRERKLKFLALVGVRPFGTRPARTLLRLTPRGGVAPFELPAAAEFEGQDLRGERTRFRTLDKVALVANRIEAVQSAEQGKFQDLTERWRRGDVLHPFGENAAPGSALYIGFRDAPPVATPCTLFFSGGDLIASAEEEARLREEGALTEKACRSPLAFACIDGVTTEGGAEETAESAGESPALAHHSARTVWECMTAPGFWRRLEASEGEVRDETRGFTLSGRVVLRVPRELVSARIGAREGELFYVRCRVVGGAYDAAPALTHLLLNAVVAEQSVSFATRLTIAEGVVAETEPGVSAPAAGDWGSFVIELNQRGEISRLRFVETLPSRPSFRVLEFTGASGADKGVLRFEADFVSASDGAPLGRMGLAQNPVVVASFRLFTLEGEDWHEWSVQQDLDASGRDSSHFTLDSDEGSLSFGDGERGRVPPRAALIFATGDATRAGRGNAQRDTVKTLTDGLHNRAVLDDFDAVESWLADISNAQAATGGSAAEKLEDVTRRALEMLARPGRAVTLADYEALAQRTPGVRLARVSARANLHPQFPCYSAPGVVTVLVLPSLPARRPVPSAALQQAVAAYLTRRRVVGTRVVVAGPTYRVVSVRARVQPRPRVDAAALRERLRRSLDRFFDPLVGGPEGAGWPFGRDVYRSEVLQLIDETPGVENVISLELLGEGGEPQCGNLCIGPTGLVESGHHEIEVVGEELCHL